MEHLETLIDNLSAERMSIISLSANDIPVGRSMKIRNDLWLTVRKGTARVASDLFTVEVEANTFSVFVSDRILEVQSVSDDFQADLFIISNSFQRELAISELLSLRHRFNSYPLIHLDDASMEAIHDYHRMALRMISLEDNPYKWEGLLCLTRAFYYSGGFYMFRSKIMLEPDDSILSRFLALVDEYGDKEHSVGFYAEKLCLTPKYLSKLIHQKTGKSAKEVISNHVLLRAKALLTNSDDHIQQISDLLCFPSQSVFGKFFKQATGVSPKMYRKTYAAVR